MVHLVKSSQGEPFGEGELHFHFKIKSLVSIDRRLVEKSHSWTNEPLGTRTQHFRRSGRGVR